MFIIFIQQRSSMYWWKWISNNTYLNNDIYTYEICYETCGAYEELGNINGHKCIYCKKYENGTYIYHFIHNKNQQYVNEKKNIKVAIWMKKIIFMKNIMKLIELRRIRNRNISKIFLF